MQVDSKKGQGNNSAKPGRPEREADRKGRTLPKQSGTGRGKEDKRDGKDWGEGRMRKEDGVAEAGQAPLAGEPEAAVHREGDRDRRREGGGEGRERREGGRGREGRERREGGGRGGAREREVVPLTPEQEAELKAAREAEERQMTLEEWQAKRAAGGAVEGVDLKEARRVEADPALKAAARPAAGSVAVEWGGKTTQKEKKHQQQQQGQGSKKEVLSLGPAPRKKRDDAAGSPPSNAKGAQRRSPGPSSPAHSSAAPAINLEDSTLFPSLGGGKK